MTRLEKWLKEAPEAEYFRDLQAILNRMPLEFDVEARARINSAFQRAAEIAMGVQPSEDR